MLREREIFGKRLTPWHSVELTRELPNAEEVVEPEPFPVLAVSVPRSGAQVYVGPKKYSLLESLGRDMEKAVWFSSQALLAWISRGIFYGLVWIHDYQLLLTPRRIRERDRDTPLAFFLHIPFPPFDIFRLLPWDRELLRGLLACNLIGFHVRGYADNFLDCVEKRLGGRHMAWAARGHCQVRHSRADRAAISAITIRLGHIIEGGSRASFC